MWDHLVGEKNFILIACCLKNVTRGLLPRGCNVLTLGNGFPLNANTDSVTGQQAASSNKPLPLQTRNGGPAIHGEKGHVSCDMIGNILLDKLPD